ncbi:hypothetical protein PILCRDRAFT_69116 [Piloderma croceum F 1598]|uniref:Aquaporin n=1 Tax=Piloderma croceum (strain F 1598) TaxID=765440 RepID=A0A0C3FZJ1_PILCF|nr:hypothetical protein PILCRDRAFT_69116 [Piloderma croceum F 1598]
MDKDGLPSHIGLPHNIYSSSSTLWHRSEQAIPHPTIGHLRGDRALPASNYPDRLRETPDATSFFTWRESFDLRGFVDGKLWRQAILEGWGTSLLVWLTGLAAYSLVPRVSDFASGALFPALLGSFVNAISLSLLIFCTGPISGGHINPLITIATFFGQLTTFPRTVLYLFFQTAGATTAGFLMRISLGKSDGPEAVILGCSIDASVVTVGEAVIFETMTCLSLIFVAYGVGLDPRQKAIYGPTLGPLLIGLALGLCTFVTAALKPGYTGASMNPARCFGLMAAEGRWDLHWVHWVGPIVAGALNAVLYWVIPFSQ